MSKTGLKFRIFRNSKKGTQYQIDIRLNDECGNGHQDFAITGVAWEKGKAKIDENMLYAGAIGERISAVFPEYKIFDKLHLCDYQGSPTYACANGFYFIKNKDKETTMSYLRITEAEYDVVKGAGDKYHLGYLLNTMGIRERWQEEANEGIKLLEELTGETFILNSERSQFGMTDLELLDTTMKVDQGYYTEEAIAQREQAKHNKAILERIENIGKDREASLAKLNTEYNIKMAVISAGILKTNFLWYNHTNILVFNWQDYGDQFTEEEVMAVEKELARLKVKVEIKIKTKGQ